MAGQESLPVSPYLLVVGTDTFVSQTIWDENPSYQKQKEGEPYNAFIHEKRRRWTYLFKEDTVRIDFPQRIDSYVDIDPETGIEIYGIDSSDHFLMNKVIDTLSKESIEQLIKTEIKVYQQHDQLEVKGLSVDILYLDGKTSGTNNTKSKVEDLYWVPKVLRRDFDKINFFVLDGVWFQDEKGMRRIIDGSIGWKLKNEKVD